MKETINLNIFPRSRVKAYDGMPVTSDVWEESHEEHRKALQAHLLYSHAPGIISGLEVSANDPADHFVFISPGAAVDSSGQVIIVDQTIAYDFGEEREGQYSLFLGYGENESGGDGGVKKIQSEYMVAARTNRPKKPVVELAQLNISAKKGAIRDAADPKHPVQDEIDLRYREDAVNSYRTVRVAVVPFGAEIMEVKSGWDALSVGMMQMTHTNLVVDLNVALNNQILNYDLIYIYAMGAVNFSESEIKQLGKIQNAGKGLFMEAIDEQSFSSLGKIAVGLGIKEKLNEKARPFTTPFLFRIPPEGIDYGAYQFGPKGILSSNRTIIFCNGFINDKQMKREDIRSCQEWAINMLSFCVDV